MGHEPHPWGPVTQACSPVTHKVAKYIANRRINSSLHLLSLSWYHTLPPSWPPFFSPHLFFLSYQDLQVCNSNPQQEPHPSGLIPCPRNPLMILFRVSSLKILKLGSDRMWVLMQHSESPSLKAKETSEIKFNHFFLVGLLVNYNCQLDQIKRHLEKGLDHESTLLISRLIYWCSEHNVALGQGPRWRMPLSGMCLKDTSVTCALAHGTASHQLTLFYHSLLPWCLCPGASWSWTEPSKIYFSLTLWVSGIL